MRGIGELLRAGLAAIAGQSAHPKFGFVSDISDYPCEFDGGTGDTYVVIHKTPRDMPADREANYMPPIDEVFDPSTNRDI